MAAIAVGVVSEGMPEPLGVSLTQGGINIAVWSSNATAVELCLFDGGSDGESRAQEAEVARIRLPGRTGPVFHGHVADLGAGVRYGLRAHGPFAPERGHRFDPDKLLVDPYALALDRPLALHPSMFGPPGGADSGPFMPKAVVFAPEAAPPAAPSPGRPWGESTLPRRPWGDSIVYELHVRGFTRAHPDIPPEIRGTFAALAHPAAIAHLTRLGITAVELMPAAAWADERHLPPLGLTNYWGYNPFAFMAPDPRLAPGGWAEVRAATDALAAAGIETLLDVVLNHSGEGDALGPTLSFRGLDNAAYYRLSPEDKAAYLNDAGTGNTLALSCAPALRLAMDSLRAWRRLGGVAGFRFDLAATLGRGGAGFDAGAPLLAAIDQDPELRGLKLIAEPWDIGPGGYRLGQFPPPWGEWNDRFRDTARSFWRGDGVPLGEVARRMTGSQDVFAGRRPSRSVNFVVAHDGFTLADLVSYETRHNLANGEDNRDGTFENRSWNHGVEGPSDDPAVVAARLADQRALLAMLLVSRGTPMLAMGAELGQTQGGNNNAYAQDNLTSWIDWARADGELTAFTARLIGLRRTHPALSADRFLTGAAAEGGIDPDVLWRAADGGKMTAAGWDDPAGETLVMALAEPGGGASAPDRVVIAIHRGAAATHAVLPEPRDGFAWCVLADSADPARGGEVDTEAVSLGPRSILLLGETASAGRTPRGVADDVLARLAAAAGIAPDWSGVDGRRHAVSPATQGALLAAMRLPAGTTREALESLRALAETQDLRPLPFVLAGRAGEAVQARLVAGGEGPPPRTWLTLERKDGPALRLRADAAVARDEARAFGRDGRARPALWIPLPPLEPGDYVLRREDEPDQPCRLIIAPGACHTPAALRGERRLWGLSVQLYALTRGGDQGIGDFTTLGALGEAAAARGAALLAINPLHALFEGDRERASPYYPSDRRFLDPIYLDLDGVPGAGDWRPAAALPRGGAAVDYTGVWALKARALEASFAAGAENGDFAAFVEAGGEALRRFAVFQAIAESRPGEAWTHWPEALRRPRTASADPARVRFHQYVQWLCEVQLAGAAKRASGLAVGLCRDLAVGAAPDGAEIWAQAELATTGVSIGAPPDPIGPAGQVWGLPPFDPHRLRADGYRSMAALIAANMRHGGALRIDHVMGLARQFWVPDGAAGAQGAYVAFPFEDLLAVLALESERARCLVIGEDLGTVPEGFRQTVAQAGLLSYRVLPFERDGAGAPLPPGAYPRQAMACVATHDLPPLAGWWEALDVAECASLALITQAQAAELRAGREADKQALLDALARAGLAPGSPPPPGEGAAGSSSDHQAQGPSAPPSSLGPALAGAIHAFIGASNAAVALAQAEDLAGERVAVNLPGTDRERPNWRRRIAVPLEQLFETTPAPEIVQALRTARPPTEEGDIIHR
jgi:glycogen operon protein